MTIASPAKKQLNIRIDANLKTRAENSMRSYGLTPTQCVNLVYETMASDPVRAAALNELLTVATRPDPRAIKKEADRKLRDVWRDFYAATGADSTHAASDASDDELLGEARWERMLAKGLDR